LAKFQDVTLTGCNSSKKYPLAAPGIIDDPDVVAALPAAGGIGITSRNGDSTSLIPALASTSNNIVKCADPL
jgi:hypothetical protein